MNGTSHKTRPDADPSSTRMGRHPGYALSQKIRRRGKDTGLLRLRVRGRGRVDMVHFKAANLIRLPKLLA